MVVALFSIGSAALPPSTTNLGSSVNPSRFGQAVTLTATVSPTSATGGVTFYDGVTVLGTSALSGGQATMTTTLLASGSRSLQAYYGGDATYAASRSTMVAQTVGAPALRQNGFLSAGNYSTGANPSFVGVADFNGDGKPDLVVGYGSGGFLSVLLGNGDGTFKPAVNYGTGSAPVSVTVGDFNGDGKADLAAANRDSNNVSVLLGNGDGTFQTAVNYNVGTSPLSLVLCDFNGDGKPDLAVANGSFDSHVVSVLLGNGDGTFQPAVSFTAGTSPRSVAVGDFDGDGKADLVVANINSNNVSVLLGKGNGTFQAAVNYDVGAFPISVAVGDFNGDGRADLAVASYSSNVVSVLLGNGDGTFQAAVNYGAGGGSPFSVTVGDFNGDGKADLAIASNGLGNVSVLMVQGDGTFQTAINYNVGGLPSFVAVGDFNDDGVSDFAVANYGVSVLLGVAIPPPDLVVSKTHTGSFTQGQNGATYALTVSNGGNGPTVGIVTIADVLPIGLTATAISGTGWSCALGTLTCMRGDVLAPLSSYPAITVTVNVAGDAAASITNTATVSGGGESNTLNGTASDVTTVISQGPDLILTKTHAGNFTQGQAAAKYAITVSNSGAGPTTGTVTVTDTLPTGVTATAISGTGWACTLGTLTCTRSDLLGAFASYLPINVTVNVASNAAASITNTATVSGGGELNTANDTASDPTTIAQTTTLALARSPNPSTLGQTVSLTATVSSTAAAGKVTFYDGVTLLGTSAVSGGQAGLSTSLLPSGTHALKAYYSGSSAYLPSTSVTVAQGVLALPQNGFRTAVNYNAGCQPRFVAVGDFNGDGRADLAVANGCGSLSNGVSVFLGNGDGTFRAAVNYGTGSGPSALAVGDFNGDGKVDLAVTNFSSSSVSVLLGNGDGTFQTAVNYNAGSGPTSVAVGDFNGDGKADLAVADSNFSGAVSVLLGNGDGTFQAAVNYNVGTNPSSVAVGDFNGDGKADLAVANSGSNTVSVLLGNGNGTFQTAVSFYAGVHPFIAVGDFNGDGKADLAVVNWDTSSQGSLSVLLGNGDGTFQAAVNYIVGTQASSIAVGDFNGDGKADLAVGNNVDNNVRILLGNGDGTFQAAVNYVAGFQPAYVAVGDFNGDGLADLAVANAGSNSVSILLGVPAPQTTALALTRSPNPSTFGQAVTLTATVSPTSATGNVTFYDGPMILGTSLLSGGQATLTTKLLPSGTRSLKAYYSGDAAFLASTSPTLTHSVVTLPQNGTLPAMSVAAGVSLDFIVVGDFNGDGKADLAVANDTSNGKVSILLGNGDGTFQPPVYYSVGTFPQSIAVGDFNGDGKPDLAVANIGASSNISILLGNGDGTFQAAVNYTAGTAPESVVVGDFNGDGKADLAVANQGSNNVSVLLGNGDGTFQPAVNYSAGNGVQFLAAGDLNGDGNADLVVVNQGSNNVSVLLGNGDGTFRPAVNYSASNQPQCVVVGDFNGDGFADLAVINSTSNNVSVLLGNGDGTFRAAVNYSVGNSPLYAALGDFNGDGKVDLAVANRGDNTLSVLFGNGDGTFQAAVPYRTGTTPMSVAVGEFNGDGRTDLAVANFSSDDVSILLGAGIPGLTISKTHTGNLTQGQIGASYSISIGNNGAGPTVGTVTVTDSLPTGLTATAISGSAWTCTLAALSCTRGDSLPSGSSYPSITVTVNVANNVPPSVTNFAAVSGGGDSGNLAGDPTTIAQIPLLYPSPTHASPAGTARVPVTLGLPSGVAASSLAFTATITPANGAPALTGTVSFSNDPAQTSGTITAAMASNLTMNFSGLSTPLSANEFHLGDVLFTVPSTATPGQSYTVDLNGITASSAGNSVNVTAGADSTVTITSLYLVGDVFPSTTDSVGGFGDGQINTLDLLSLLRAVTKLPGAVPLTCSDRFDAMDVYPVDVGGTRGGDGVLNTLDILALLRRVTNVDMSRPTRTSPPPCPSLVSEQTRVPETGRPEGLLTLAMEGQRTAIYLRANVDLSLSGLSFALGSGKSRMRFTPASAHAPTLIDSALAGKLALAWLGGLEARAGDRMLLGYVETVGSLGFFGTSANAKGTGRPVRIDTVQLLVR